MICGPWEKFGRPKGWPGSSPNSVLRTVSEGVRRQVILTDLLGNVKVTGNARSVNVRLFKESCRIEAPVADEFEKALEVVEALAEMRGERAGEIMAQLRYHPAFWANILPLNPRTTPRTLELMAVAVAFTSHVVQRAKLLFNLPRPAELSPRIQPLIPTPPYSTFPSGHAAESRVLACLLHELVVGAMSKPDPNADEWEKRLANLLPKLADRIAKNREIAGIHFSADSESGKALGTFLAKQLCNAAHKDSPEDAPAAPGHPFACLWQQAHAEWGG